MRTIHLAMLMVMTSILSACGHEGIGSEIAQGDIRACSDPLVHERLTEPLYGLREWSENKYENELYLKLVKETAILFENTTLDATDLATKAMRCSTEINETLNGETSKTSVSYELQPSADNPGDFVFSAEPGFGTPLIAFIQVKAPPELVALHNANPAEFPNLKPIPPCRKYNPADPYTPPDPCFPIDKNDPSYDHSHGDQRPAAT